MEEIQSVQNPKIKAWYQLRNKKGREKSGLYMIEGIKLIEEAIRFDQAIEYLLFEKEQGIPSRLLNLLKEDHLHPRLIAVTSAIIQKLSDTETPQGVLAIVKQQTHSLEKLLAERGNYLLLVDEIQDPGNLGAMIRNADAAGVEAVFLGKGTVELYNPKVLRAAMGSIFHLPIHPIDLNNIMPMLKEKNIQVIGTSPHAEKAYFDLDFTQKTAILVGNEAKGLSAEKQSQVDHMVKIPIMGHAESLNVAMAAGVILFERVRQLHSRS